MADTPLVIPDFQTFLMGKKIDPLAFRDGDLPEWETWKPLYAEMGPASFDLYMKYRFNPVRRAFPLAQPVPALANSHSKEVLPAQEGNGEPLPRKKLPLARPVIASAEAASVETALPVKKPPLARPVMKNPVSTEEVPGTEITNNVQTASPGGEIPDDKVVRKKMPLAKPLIPPRSNQPES